MSIIDNTLAAQVPQFDPATPLKQAAQLQAADTENRQAQFKQAQLEIGSEARGLAAVQNSPEFPSAGLRRPTVCTPRACWTIRLIRSGATRRRRCCSSR
jgi:hypothetical protein